MYEITCQQYYLFSRVKTFNHVNPYEELQSNLFLTAFSDRPRNSFIAETKCGLQRIKIS